MSQTRGLGDLKGMRGFMVQGPIIVARRLWGPIEEIALKVGISRNRSNLKATAKEVDISGFCERTIITSTPS